MHSLWRREKINKETVMKRIWFLVVGIIVIALVTLYGVASADNPLTYDVYVVG